MRRRAPYRSPSQPLTGAKTLTVIEGRHLALPGLRLRQGLLQGLQLLLPPHERVRPRAAAACRRDRTMPAPVTS